MTANSVTNAPFRCDIVGSFLRPDVLKQARADFNAGIIDAAQLKTVEDVAIRDLVAKQKAAGLKVVTDGEFRRSYWHLDFMWGLQGIERRTSREGYMFHDEETTADTAVVTGPICMLRVAATFSSTTARGAFTATPISWRKRACRLSISKR